MADEPTAQRITFHFEKADGYRLVPANGVWGGVTPKGDFKLEFFVESMNTPDSLTNRLEGGNVGPEESRMPDRRLVRTLQCGVLISTEHAEAFAQFILDRVKEYRAIIEAMQSNASARTDH